MQITSNIPFVIGTILSKFRELDNPETISRAAALAVLPELRNRIHVEGLDSKGAKIGTYSNSYMQVRERYNRTADKNVVASLTRQLENNYTLKATENGYTIDNLGNTIEGDTKTKTDYLEEKYGDIWLLTEKEQDITRIVAEETAIALINS
jgi:hypothetical protein